jgi:S-adenosylmethionine hydrolase
MPPVTLTTDFGISSPYVAAMKGVMLTINPELTIVDLTHAIAPQDIRHAALVLAEMTPWFPPGTLHVAVVDPGVGTNRSIVFVEIAGQRYLGPDNGLFSRLALTHRPTTIVELGEPRHWLPQVSRTFHGRDIMAPVAAWLSLGLDPLELGPRRDQIHMLPWAEVVVGQRKITGQIQSIDSFGNLVTDITEAALADVPRGESTIIHCDEHQTHGIFQTYADQPEMTLIALVGSSGHLEIAIVGDSAAIMLGVKPGTPVKIEW